MLLPDAFWMVIVISCANILAHSLQIEGTIGYEGGHPNWSTSIFSPSKLCPSRYLIPVAISRRGSCWGSPSQHGRRAHCGAVQPCATGPSPARGPIRSPPPPPGARAATTGEHGGQTDAARRQGRSGARPPSPRVLGGVGPVADGQPLKQTAASGGDGQRQVGTAAPHFMASPPPPLSLTTTAFSRAYVCTGRVRGAFGTGTAHDIEKRVPRSSPVMLPMGRSEARTKR